MKKRLLAMLMAGAMALTMTACGGADTAKTDDAAGTKTDAAATGDAAAGTASGKNYRIALCMSHQTNAFTTAVSAGAKAKGEELGVTVDVFDGKQDQATQTSQIEQAINSGYDGILVEPVSVDGIVPAVKEANDAKIPVITVVQKMSGQEQYAKAYCGGDDSKAGELQMTKVCEELGGKGNIAVLYGPMGSDGQLIRKQGYDKVLKANPNVKMVFDETANWVTADALTLVENWLQTGTELNAIVAQNDGMAMGALKAVEDAGLQDKIKVYGIDAVDDAVAAIAAGRLSGTISQDAPGQGALGVDTMVKLLNGETVQPTSYTECIWINKDNVAQYQKK